MSRERFFNFPVTLLRGFLDESRRADILSSILYYATYSRAVQIALYEDGLDEPEVEKDHFTRAMDELNWKMTGNNKTSRIQNAMKQGREIKQVNTKAPHTGIARSIYWDYHDNKKTEWQAAQLLGFLALKSIAGDSEKRRAVLVNNAHWMARMSGLIRATDGELDPWVREFNTEYKSKKLRKLLVAHWGMKHYAQHTRGFWVSFNKSMTVKELALIAEKAKVSNKIKRTQNDEKEARLAALEKLGIAPRPNKRP